MHSDFSLSIMCKARLRGICPQGFLVTGRGSRYILANTEKLHEKILQLADRILALETALRAVHAEHFRCLPRSPENDALPPPPPHPLLQGKDLLIKGQLELYGVEQMPPKSPTKRQASSDSSGTGVESFELSASAHGAILYAEDVIDEAPNKQMRDHSSSSTLKSTQIQALVPQVLNSGESRGLPADIIQLSTSSTSAWSKIVNNEKKDIQPIQLQELKKPALDYALYRIHTLLPTRAESDCLCKAVSENASSLYDKLLLIFTCFPYPLTLVIPVYSCPPAPTFLGNMALLFIILAVGALADLTRPRGSASPADARSHSAEEYYLLARAALGLHAAEFEARRENGAMNPSYSSGLWWVSLHVFRVGLRCYVGIVLCRTTTLSRPALRLNGDDEAHTTLPPVSAEDSRAVDEMVRESEKRREKKRTRTGGGRPGRPPDGVAMSAAEQCFRAGMSFDDMVRGLREMIPALPRPEENTGG
ncbi:hypothetical protein EW145_g5829 [Phellinidium pouzarii]|uniref:Transcription factor domain-containing protein n=1 Tax=Phellinidium pouzarii TaxID=167371 RepID=A0A4S4KYN2_9AGAM|nr:hypothetical protein EW145_g5829 [Phellinidium pouzarii]